MTIPNAKTFKNNQQKGRDFENRYIQYLSRQGFWAHFMHPAPDGSQPFDIIACKESMVCAFDCKTLDDHRFPLDRAEDNQMTSFEMLNRRGIHNTYFVVEIAENRVCLIPSQYVADLKRAGQKSLDMRGMENESICIE